MDKINKYCDLLIFLNSLDDYIQIMDTDLNILWMNDAAKKLVERMGIIKHDHLSLFEWLPFLKSNEEKIISEYKQAIQSGEKVTTEDVFLINGEKIYTKTIKIPISKNDKKYIITIVYDQTYLQDSINHKKMEIDRLFGIFDSIDEIVYVTDPNNYEIIYINKYFLDMISKKRGFSLEEIKKYKCYEIFQDLDSPCSFCTNDILKENPEEHYRWIYFNPILQKHFLITDKLVTWTDNKKVRFELAIDITDEMEIRKKLEQSNKMLEDFAHVISHDLREPLRTVVNFLSILKEPDNIVLQNNAEWIDKAYNSSSRMQKMINKLLILSKLHQYSVFEKAEINTKSMINEIIIDLDLKIQETSTLIEIDENISNIYGEYYLISQVFSNLIRNAIRAVNEDKNPIIKISSVKKKDHSVFIIEDNGMGMTQEQIQHLFYENSEWKPPTDLDNGIGLSICRRAISLHNGSIYAESDGHSGTKIYFTIPNRKE